MKKLLSILMVVAMLLALFAGCAGNTAAETPAAPATPDTPAAPEEPAAPAEKVELTVALWGDEARKAFDKIDKRGAMYISWFDHDHTKDITWELNTAEAFDKFTEVYVVGKNFEWTYIKTHEDGAFGPYFLRREVKK